MKGLARLEAALAELRLAEAEVEAAVRALRAEAANDTEKAAPKAVAHVTEVDKQRARKTLRRLRGLKT